MKIDYTNLYTKVYKKTIIPEVLKGVSLFAVVSCVASVCLLTVLSLVSGGVIPALKTAVILGVPFVLVSLLRRWLNAPRPVDELDLTSLGIDTAGFKRGYSFPSRHVFSGFLISVAAMPEIPTLGVVLLLLSAALAACRVLLGIHYLKDTLVGAVLGSISAAIGLLILG